MVNIDKNNSQTDVRSHKETLILLEEYLKNGYSETAQERLKKKGIEVSKRTIRGIKTGARENWKVLEVLAEIALENKAAKERVEQLINSN